jgi:hypothetical protein
MRQSCKWAQHCYVSASQQQVHWSPVVLFCLLAAAAVAAAVHTRAHSATGVTDLQASAGRHAAPQMLQKQK